MCAVEQFSSNVLLQLTEVLKPMNDLYEEFASDGWECLIMHACSKCIQHLSSHVARVLRPRSGMFPIVRLH